MSHLGENPFSRVRVSMARRAICRANGGIHSNTASASEVQGSGTSSERMSGDTSSGFFDGATTKTLVVLIRAN